MTTIGYTIFRLPTSLWRECRDYACPEACDAVFRTVDGPRRTFVEVKPADASSFLAAVAAAVDMAQDQAERRTWRLALNRELTKRESYGPDHAELCAAARRILAP